MNFHVISRRSTQKIPKISFLSRKLRWLRGSSLLKTILDNPKLNFITDNRNFRLTKIFKMDRRRPGFFFLYQKAKRSEAKQSEQKSEANKANFFFKIE
jgi:hypothetical protein